MTAVQVHPILFTENLDSSDFPAGRSPSSSPQPSDPPLLPPNSWNDQPVTQAGHMRTRVFVACQACRSRKIKCDGLKPVCKNCIKKEFAPGPSYRHLLPTNESYKLANGVCLYDRLPKRRGPDRLPGARVRKKSRADNTGPGRTPRRRSATDPGARRPLESPPGPSGAFDTTKNEKNERTGPLRYESLQVALSTTRMPEQAIQRPQPSMVHPNASGISFPPEKTYSTGGFHPNQPDYGYMPPSLDFSPTSPLTSGSSSDEFKGPQRLLGASHGRIYIPESPEIAMNSIYRTARRSVVDDYSMPPARPSLSPLSEPPTARISRGRRDIWDPVDGNIARGHSTFRLGEKPSYEYVSGSGAYIQILDDSSDPDEQHRSSAEEMALYLPVEPGSSFVQKTWFDGLLDIYASPEMQISSAEYYHTSTLTLNSEARTRASNSIYTDLRHLFTRASWWFSFIHVPTLWAKLYSPELRTELQPGLLMSALSLAIFFKSSEAEGGVWGRERAARLKAHAEAAVDSSLAVGWVDIGLAQAAWFLAMYEMQPHPYHSLQKTRSAMARVDNILRLLKYTSVDADNPLVTRFNSRATPLDPNRLLDSSCSSGKISNPDQCPAQDINHLLVRYPKVPSGPNVRWPSSSTLLQSSPHDPNILPYSSPLQHKRACKCEDLCLGEHHPELLKHTPLWRYTASWACEHEPGEIMREEARRTVWSFITIASSLAGHTASLGTSRSSDVYWSASAENLAVLYPGEAAFYYDQASDPTSHIKDSVWALYARAQLLWLACLRMRQLPRTSTDMPFHSGDDLDEAGLYSLSSVSNRYESRPIAISEAEFADFTIKAWLQTREIEEALDAHTCNLERAYLFHGREYLSTIRMTMTQEFSRYVPYPNSGTSHHFNRPQADNWLKHQAGVAQSLLAGKSHITEERLIILADRPYFVWWFMIQVVRLLNLWACDHSMKDAVQLCFAFLPAIDYLTSLWPSENQRNKYISLRLRLENACLRCGIPFPPPTALPSNISASSRSL